MSSLAWISWGATLLVVVFGGLFRSRFYAIFRAVLLTIYNLIALPLFPHLGFFLPIALYLHAAVYLDAAFLIRPTLRPMWYRWLFSWPAQYMSAAVLLSFPWAIAAAFGLSPWGLVLPFLLAAVGMVQSLTSLKEEKDIVIGDVAEVNGVVRVSEVPMLSDGQGEATPLHTIHGRPLRVAQITDPHLGPFMPVARLQAVCERVVAQDPDLVLLTGDYLTMESQAESRWLADGLSPLRALEGRVFACLGNHDHESLSTVKEALEATGAQLLVDELALASTPVGDVEILGFDFHFRDRKQRMEEVCARHPRQPGRLRLALLHDPGAFKHLESGEADIVFAGHTHGGQVGLLSFGSMWTMAGWAAKMPDHGLWGRGKNRLYVHRGTGHYGFPLRLGVPSEESVLSLYGRAAQYGRTVQGQSVRPAAAE